MSTPPAAPEGYTVLRRLGGGECEVYEVRDAAGGRWALKRLGPAAAAREDLALRLRAEGEFLRLLGGRHGVLRCHAVLDSPPALVLEYAGGGSLADRLSPALPPDEALRVFRRLLEAVAHCHAQGVVHRDLKPSNVLFTGPGEMRLGDFGVAARTGTAGPLAPEWEEERVGTLAYAAPEQLVDPAAGAREAADVYSLGVVLYEMLTGRLPFELRPGEDEAGLAARIGGGGPVPPRERAPWLSAALEEVILTALRRDPLARYPTASALRRALDAAAPPADGRGAGLARWAALLAAAAALLAWVAAS